MSDKGKRRQSSSNSSVDSAPSKKSQKTKTGGGAGAGSSKVMKMLTKLVQEGKARDETEAGLSSGKAKSKKPSSALALSKLKAPEPVITNLKAGSVVVLNCGLEAMTASTIQPSLYHAHFSTGSKGSTV